MTLLETWRKWADDNAEDNPPYVLDADKESEEFRKLEARGRIGAYGNKQEPHHDPNLKPNRLNVGLLPYPFIGDLEKATIFVLMANPNAKPCDAYDGDGWDKKKHIANLEQDFSGMELPFESLSRQPKPDGYWYSRLKRTIERIMKKKSLSHEDAIDLVAKDLAVIQRSPYWSTGFVGGVEKLPSAQLAVDYVKDSVVPRVLDGNAILIVMRRLNDWKQALPGNFEEVNGITIDKNRYGWLTPNTAGGKAILKHFGIDTDS